MNVDYYAPRTLNPRQTQIMRRLAHGQRRTDIAADLGISLRTVNTNIRLVRSVHNARNTAHLMAILCRAGMMDDAWETADA